MAETPVGYFPDVPVQYVPSIWKRFQTEILVSVSGREQRRKLRTGLRRWTASTTSLSQADRKAVADFFAARSGAFDAFYFWTPVHEQYGPPYVSVGSVTAATRLVIPYRITNSLGSAVGSIGDVQIAGTTTAFTSRSLLPRNGTYAALRFNNANDYVACGSGASLRPTVSYSIFGWIYLTNNTSTITIVTSEAPNASGFLLYLVSGVLTFRTSFAASSTTSVGPTIPLNRWAHFGVVKNANGTAPTFYLNGAASVGVGTITNNAAATVPFTISQTGGGQPLDGMLSDVRFYDASVTGAEVTQIYNGNPTPSANLRGWWRLTEGTGATAADSSGNANTGTLTNAPLWVSGEEELNWSSPQTGAVTITGLLRERVIARSENDDVAQSFDPRAALPLAILPIAIKELL
jgi:hypothetical protein